MDECQLSWTILIKNVTNFNEAAIQQALEITEDVIVDRVLDIGDSQVLIDFTTDTTGQLATHTQTHTSDTLPL